MVHLAVCLVMPAWRLCMMGEVDGIGTLGTASLKPTCYFSKNCFLPKHYQKNLSATNVCMCGHMHAHECVCTCIHKCMHKVNTSYDASNYARHSESDIQKYNVSSFH